MSEEKLPKGWKKTILGKVTSWSSGGTPNRGVSHYYNGRIPWIKTGDLNDGVLYESSEFISDEGLKNSSAKLFPKGSIAMAMYGATIGKTAIFGIEASTNQACAVAKPSDLINHKFLFYFLKSQKKEFVEKGKGGAQPNISLTVIKNHLINLPSIPEQQRIVEKLNTIFGHLDVLREKLDRIPVLLKNFRKQVLIKAVTGELTGDLEIVDYFILESSITIGNEIQVKPKKWRWCMLTELARLESGHTPRKSCEDYWEKGNVPWISLQDIRSAHGKVINDTKYMPNQKGIENSSARMLPAGTVCFSRDISVGFSTIMGREMATSQHFANWICGENLSNKFLLYAFMASRDYLIGEGKGTTVGTIYMPALKQMHILLPPLDIQNEIVKQLDTLFDLADKIESQYQSLKAKINQMPQAILAKAFRGELVGQEVKDYVRETGEVIMAAEDFLEYNISIKNKNI